ncbi:FGGY N domain containing protein, partial [Asbolus verrucosus]
MLCNLNKPIMSDQNAASWGYFDCVKHQWNDDILKETGFPTSLLPEIRLSGEIAGYLDDNWHSIPKGTPIGIALADLQCSVLSTIETSKDAVLNISTSAQIAFVAEDYKPHSGPPSMANLSFNL